MLILGAPNLSAMPGVAHAFFGRTGGVSTGIYASLNCGPGSGDAHEAVMENRRRALARLLPGDDARLVTLYQVHGSDTVAANDAWEPGAAPRADAVVTTRRGLALGILAADCAPVLLADPEAGVIGAAHAGWKGALAGIAGSVVAAMIALGAQAPRIRAAIGPCISQANYEVGPEFRERFLAALPGSDRYFDPGSRIGHSQFALETFVADRLAAAGVGSVAALGACTYAAPERFFSYRRTTHRGEPDYGRNLSAIALLP